MHCYFSGALLIAMLPSLLVIEFLLGVLGNGLALWVFFFHLKPWKSSTVLLFNLAIADFLLNAVLPLRANYYHSRIDWIFGDFVCNMVLFMLAMNRTGSTVFLMAVALDRYMRVVHPHHPINSLSVPKAMCGAFLLWLIPILTTTHVFFSNHLFEHDNRTYCESFMIETDIKQNMSWHKFLFFLSFLVPLIVILYCTGHIILHLRRRQLAQHAKFKKALYFITVVAVLFIICFLPSNIVQLQIWVKTNEVARTLQHDEICPALDDLTSAFYITISLTYLNSGLDPVVYYFSSPVFKRICRRALHLPELDTMESTERKTRDTGSQSLSQL